MEYKYIGFVGCYTKEGQVSTSITFLEILCISDAMPSDAMLVDIILYMNIIMSMWY